MAKFFTSDDECKECYHLSRRIQELEKELEQLKEQFQDKRSENNRLRSKIDNIEYWGDTYEIG